ncbi:hypothetical protein [Arthrobacter globiformis]|uniref:hypothetical protein n=1 Tax=Arthrobacter globiformis TaxID=1665 RepID=UPI00278B6860|nr:hypothetical protein [Arthrobacter globiformis]MDQ0864781.1 hypothetical protein [Arthrobacter globiformis]
MTEAKDACSWSITAEGAGTRLTISLSSGVSAGMSVVRITVGQIKTDMDVRRSLAFWQRALNRLAAIVRDIRHRRNSPKQALIVIHGIGEQQPGQTLMAFVDAVFGKANEGPRWVKQDTLSGSFEMRKVTIPAAAGTEGREGRPTTHVYELYWAHLIVDSTVGQVLAWMKSLLMRRDVPPLLRLQVWIARVLAAAVVAAVLWLPVLALRGDAKTAAVSGGVMAVAAALVGAAWKLFKPAGTKLFTGFLGDAARYFQPKPENVAHRQEIREEGVRLLERLHKSGEYQRVIIAAHSLGSAIAYDILTFAWNSIRKQDAAPDARSYSAFRAVEDALPDASEDASEDAMSDGARKLQFAAWQELRKNTQPWLVTDLITMGSPLTHGPFLMADTKSDFSALVESRIFPTCPPMRQGDRGRPLSYAMPNLSIDGTRQGSSIIPDHGALFAFTRWTNLYFPVHGFIGGDPVGGPLQRFFGRWISDRPVRARKAGFWGFAHTYYWTMDGPSGKYIGRPGEDHISCLRDSLDLRADRRLRALANQIPAHAYLRPVPPSSRQE